MKQKACFPLVILVSVASLCFGQKKAYSNLEVPELRTDSITLLPPKAWVCGTEDKTECTGGRVRVYPFEYETTYDKPPYLFNDTGVIQALIKYPEEEMKACLQGKSIVQVTVLASGQVKDIIVLRSLGEGFNKQITAAFSSLPKFTAAYRNGKPVESMILYPVVFMIR